MRFGFLLRPVVTAAVATTLVAGCGEPQSNNMEPEVGDPLSFAVDKPGPYSAGYHAMKATYTPPAGLPSRTIDVIVFYPTLHPGGDNPNYGPLSYDETAYIDAPPATPKLPGGYPVLVHSHGYKGWAGANYKVAKYLASHGWAVVEPSHLGNTISDTPPKNPLALYAYRPLDTSAALDVALNPPSGDILTGKLDGKHVGMTGHSFGTYTMWAIAGTKSNIADIQDACTKGDITDCSDPLINSFTAGFPDSRAKVIIPLAGGRGAFMGTNPVSPNGIPVLSMYGSLNDSGEQAIYDATSGLDYTLVEIEGGCHELFDLGNNAAGNMGADTTKGTCRDLPDDEGFAIVNTLMLSYLRYHVLEDRSADVTGIVMGTKSVSSRVTLQHKK